MHPDPDGCAFLFIEVAYPWPPNQANRLEAGTWQLELLLCGDNVAARAYFVTISYDGFVPEPPDQAMWDHFVIEGPWPQMEPRPTATRTHNM